MKKILVAVLAGALFSGCTGKAALSQPPSSEEINSAKSKNSPVAISGIHGERNSAKGIDVAITFENVDPERTIKYATFHVKFINSVNDPVEDKISGKKLAHLKFTGPLKPGKISWGGLKDWPASFYHPNAESLEINSVDVEFMNGENMPGVDLNGVFGTTGVIKQKMY